MLNFGKASKQTHKENLSIEKSPTYSPKWLKFPPLKRQNICCPDVTKEDGLFLKRRISQHDRVDNHSRDMDKLFFFIK